MDWWEETVAPQILESGHGTFGGCFYLKQDLSTSLSQQEREPAELFSVAVQSCDPPPHATAHTCAFKAMRRECVCAHVTARPSTLPGLWASSLWGWDTDPYKASITQRGCKSRPEGKAPHCGDRRAPSNPISTSLLCCVVVMESSTDMAGN